MTHTCQGLSREVTRESNETDFHVRCMETRLHDSAVSAAVGSHGPGQVHYLIDCWSALSVQNSKRFAKPPISMYYWQKVTGLFPQVFLGPQMRQRRRTVLPNSHYATHTQRLTQARSVLCEESLGLPKADPAFSGLPEKSQWEISKP